MLRILHDTKYDFIKLVAHRRRRHRRLHRRSGLISLGDPRRPELQHRVHRRHARCSCEFTQAARRRPAVARTVDAAGFTGAEIQQFGSDTRVHRSARRPSQARRRRQGRRASRRRSRRRSSRSSARTTCSVVRTEAVGPRVGDELSRNAIIAILHLVPRHAGLSRDSASSGASASPPSSRRRTTPHARSRSSR